MSLTSDAMIADVAAIHTRIGSVGAFGSGRLIAPALVLTARHVLEVQKGVVGPLDGWRIRLIKDRQDGIWSGEPHFAKVAWFSKKNPALDLALLQIETARPEPAINLEFASFNLAEPVEAVAATGFPEAVWGNDATVRDYTVRGSLRIATQHAPFVWTVPPADKPDSPRKWSGMSGAVVGHADFLGRLHIFGAVQQIPAHFSFGMIEVARLSVAFDDGEFVQILTKAAAGLTAPKLTAWSATMSRDDLSGSNGRVSGAPTMKEIRASIRGAIDATKRK